MKYRTRTYYTDAQKALMWERWKDGWTLHQIAHLFDRAHTSVRGVLAQTGGFRPPQRSRSAIALTLAEREEISLRRTRGMRRSRHHTQKTDVHGQIVGAVSISERPASAEDRAVPGHWKVI